MAVVVSYNLADNKEEIFTIIKKRLPKPIMLRVENSGNVTLNVRKDKLYITGLNRNGVVAVYKPDNIDGVLERYIEDSKISNLNCKVKYVDGVTRV